MQALVTIGKVVVEGGHCCLLAVVLLGIHSWVLVWPCRCGSRLWALVAVRMSCRWLFVGGCCCCCHIDNEARPVSSFVCLVAMWYQDFESVDGGGELCLPRPTIARLFVSAGCRS
jgi:hypothetical protein